MNRRTFIKVGLAGLAVGGVGSVAYTLGIEPHWLELTRRDLPIDALPPALEGATLAQLSDLHIGPQVSDTYLRETFATVRALAPDVVVYTGDFLSYSEVRGEAQYQQLHALLAEAPRGGLATLGILGNHDYGHGWREVVVAHRVVEAAERAGIRILRNEAVTVAGGLDVIGVDDLWAGQGDPPRALRARSQSAALVLVHNPDAADEPRWGDYRGWMLAGHTHGGQCKAPFLPPPLLPVRNRRYVAGAVSVDAGRTLYISRGVGHLIQARFNVRPEVTLFTLRRAAL